MLGAFYTAASGVLTQQRMLNAIANNVDNAQTPGYKKDRVLTSSFQQELVRQEGNRNTVIGTGDTIRTVREVAVDLGPSSVQDTGRALDFAITGQGFFNVVDANGDTYMTRNGSFALDDEGFLVTETGARVQGTRGDIEIGKADNFSVTPQGLIYTSEGRSLGVLQITMPTEGTQLRKVTNGMYVVDESPALTPQQMQTYAETGELPVGITPGTTVSLNPNIQQGVLESSNVNMGDEMTQLMATQRRFQQSSKALEIIDTLNQRTAQIAEL